MPPEEEAKGEGPEDSQQPDQQEKQPEEPEKPTITTQELAKQIEDNMPLPFKLRKVTVNLQYPMRGVLFTIFHPEMWEKLAFAFESPSLTYITFTLIVLLVYSIMHTPHMWFMTFTMRSEWLAEYYSRFACAAEALVIEQFFLPGFEHDIAKADLFDVSLFS